MGETKVDPKDPRETLKEVSKCLIHATLKRKDFQQYQKQTREEKKAIVEDITNRITELIVSRSSRRKLTMQTKLNQKDEKKYKNIIKCFVNHPLDGMNEEALKKLRKSVEGHLIDDIIDGQNHGDYFLKAIQPLVKPIIGNFAQKQGEKWGGKGARWVSEKVIDGVFGLIGRIG